MKIAVFYNLLFGGAKRVAYEQVKGLKKIGHTIDVYTTDTTKDSFDFSLISNKFYSYNVRIPNIPFWKKLIIDFYTFLILPKIHKKIAREIDKHKYDLVLVHPDKSTQAPFILRYLKTASVYYCEEPLRIVYEYSLRFKKRVIFFKKWYEILTRQIRKKIDRENTQSAKYHIASCYHIRERMIEIYEVFPYVSYPGIDIRVFKPFQKIKKNQILFLGNKNVVTDGYDLIVLAIKKIPKKYRPKLVVVEWKKNDHERLSENELVELYNISLVAVCMSRLETFGLVPLEAMACGIPVIATNVSGHRETILNGKTGMLVDFDPDEIAEKILFLLKNRLYIQKMGKQARKWAEKDWSWEKRISDLENILLKIKSKK